MKCEAFVIFCMSTVLQTAKAVYDDYENTHTRQWTSWYNTDNPRFGRGDDESVNSIRKRGFDVCDGNEPLDAICRMTSDTATVFNEHTTTFTRDILFVPCSAQGVICRDLDQKNYNHNCSDYSVRFECLVLHKQDRSENLGIIAVAAGLSVIVPILCVLVMHVMRLVKERRNQGQLRRGSTSSSDSQEAMNQDQAIQTELGDAPPTYDQLFGADFGSTAALLGSSFPQSTNINNGEANNSGPSTSQTDSEEGNTTPNGSIYSVSDGQLDTISLTSIQTENETLPPQRGFRLPGMHISIFDLITSQQDDGQTSQVSPTSLDYIQTPPPTYKDALALFGLSCGDNCDTEKS